MQATSAHERLRLFLFESRQTPAQFSRAIGCSVSHACRLIHGDRRPSLQLADVIERATAHWTRGPIWVADWYPPEKVPPLARSSALEFAHGAAGPMGLSFVGNAR